MGLKRTYSIARKEKIRKLYCWDRLYRKDAFMLAIFIVAEKKKIFKEYSYEKKDV